MVTLAYFLVLSLMVSGIFLIYIFLLHKSPREILFFILTMYGGAHREWVLFPLVWGLVIAIVKDFKVLKEKRKKVTEKGA